MWGWNHRPWIGIDLGCRDVKVAVVSQRGPRVRLVDSAVVRRDCPWSADELSCCKPRSSRRELEAALSQLSIAPREVRAAVCLPWLACEHLVVRGTSSDEVVSHELVSRELTAAGSGLKAFQYDSWPASHRSDPPRLSPHNQNVVAVSDDWANHVTDEVQSLGLRCRVLDALPMLLQRVVTSTPASAHEGAVAVLDVGYAAATLCVVRDHNPVYVRTLRNAALDHFLQPICTALPAELGEAERLVRQYGVGVATGSQAHRDVARLLGELFHAPLQNLVDELRRTFDHLRGMRPGLVPARVLLTGGGGALLGLAEHLSHQLGLPVERWRPFASGRATGRGVDWCQLASAMALSLVGCERAELAAWEAA